MTLAAGTKLGPYEIQSAIGAGGMGEVYRATDTRLNRTVAIKILPHHLSDDPNAKQRFEREARTISSLNHPHICVLHDVGSQDGTDFLVMEYVQGETLESRLQKGPLPLKQALECGVQICDALEKAHRAGIVHRDLKPANVMLTSSGAKLLDFGLAKPSDVLDTKTFDDPSRVTPSTPTLTLSALGSAAGALTQQGTIVGTFQYMAPEVLQGGEADARSDIFSFGCVLYEMITGRRAFEGKSHLSVVTAILEKEPEALVTARPGTPPELEQIVQASLAKNPDERFQTAHDIKLQLRWLGSGAGTTGASGLAPMALRTARLAWLLAAVAGVCVVLLAIGYARRQPSELRSFRAEINTRSEQQFGAYGPTNNGFAISPDGTRVVYSATSAGATSLWLRNLDHETPQQLPGTDDGGFPFWAPDGQKIGYFAQGKLKTLVLGPNRSLTICDAPTGRGGTWNRNGVIVFTPNINQPLFAVPDSGGAPRAITEFDKTRVYSNRWPYFLPDGDHFLYLEVLAASQVVSLSGIGNGTVRVGSLSGKETRELLGVMSPAEYAAGHLLYTRADDVLVAQEFDAGRLVLKGDPVPIAQNLLRVPTLFRTFFSVSQTGVLTYAEGGDAIHSQVQALIVTDRKGNRLATVADSTQIDNLRFSPDGSRVLFDSRIGPGHDLWIYDLARTLKTRLTFGEGKAFNAHGVWSADGRRIAFLSFAPGKYSIHVKHADGSGSDEAITDDDVLPRWPGDWSPDQKYLALVAGTSFTVLPLTSFTNNRIELLDLQGQKAPPSSVASIGSGEGKNFPRFSPDGKWLAYMSNESGQSQVMVTSFPGTTGRWQVSTDGGTSPAWRGDGKELFYIGPAPANWVLSVEVVKNGDGLGFGKPQKLFQVLTPGGTLPFDVSRDGKSFLVVTSNSVSPPPIILVTNWPAELKK